MYSVLRVIGEEAILQHLADVAPITAEIELLEAKESRSRRRRPIRLVAPVSEEDELTRHFEEVHAYLEKNRDWLLECARASCRPHIDFAFDFENGRVFDDFLIPLELMSACVGSSVEFGVTIYPYESEG